MRCYFTIVDAEGEFNSTDSHEFRTLDQVEQYANVILSDLWRDAFSRSKWWAKVEARDADGQPFATLSAAVNLQAQAEPS